MSENIVANHEPNILAIMFKTEGNIHSGSYYVESPIFRKNNYIKSGNGIFDNTPLAKDATPTMKLVVRMNAGSPPAYLIFSEIVPE